MSVGWDFDNRVLRQIVRGLRRAVPIAVCLLVSPTAASAQSQENARQAWMVRVSTHIARFTRNPDLVRRLSCEEAREGHLIVEFTINRAGQVMNARVFQSAKVRALDQAVIAAVKQASPVPAPPASVVGASLPLRLPVSFISKCTSIEDGG